MLFQNLILKPGQTQHVISRCNTNFHFLLVSQPISGCNRCHFCTNVLSQCVQGERISCHNVCKKSKWILMLTSSCNCLFQCTFKRFIQSLFTLCAGQWFDNLNVLMGWQDVHTWHLWKIKKVLLCVSSTDVFGRLNGRKKVIMRGTALMRGTLMRGTSVRGGD